MKKKFITALLLIFILTAAFILSRFSFIHEAVAFHPLIERTGTQAQLAEWASTKSTGENLIRIVRDRPDDIKNRIALAHLYIREARISGNHAYYEGAALQYISEVLKKEPNHFEALILKALIHLSRHQFSEGLSVATKAQQSNPYNAFVYGLMVDAHVELGNYQEAVKNADQMVSICPDIRSYSRISYLREIHGDYPGAIAAMKMAVEAGVYGDETTEWARVQLAKLYEKTGDVKQAELHYTIALDERPGYAHAIAGLADLASARKDYKTVISLYEQALAVLPEPTFNEGLAHVYWLMGKNAEAKESINKAIHDLEKEFKNENHDSNLELAHAWSMAGNDDLSLEYALKAYNTRPKNIDVNETLAWAYFKNGDAQKAVPYLEVALKTGSKNPTLLCRAGVIYAKASQKTKSRWLLEDGLRMNANIDVQLKEESIAALKTL